MVMLAEELLLLGLHDRQGTGPNMKRALAGGMLLDLLHANCVDVPRKRVIVANLTSAGNSHLDDLLAEIAARRQRTAKFWVERSGDDMWNRLAEGLVAQGILRRDVKKVLRIFSVTRYPLIQPRVKAETRDRLQSMVDARQPWDLRTAALGGLVYAGGVEKLALPERRARDVRRVLKPVAKGAWAAHPTLQATLTATWTILKAVRASSSAGGGGDGGDGGGG